MKNATTVLKTTFSELIELYNLNIMEQQQRQKYKLKQTRTKNILKNICKMVNNNISSNKSNRIITSATTAAAAALGSIRMMQRYQ